MVKRPIRRPPTFHEREDGNAQQVSEASQVKREVGTMWRGAKSPAGFAMMTKVGVGGPIQRSRSAGLHSDRGRAAETNCRRAYSSTMRTAWLADSMQAAQAYTVFWYIRCPLISGKPFFPPARARSARFVRPPLARLAASLGRE